MAINSTERGNTPVIFCTMTDQDDRKITYIQFFDGTEPIQERIKVLSEWYTSRGFTEICESRANIADITSKWNDQDSCDLRSYDYFDIHFGRVATPQHKGPAWVVWTANGAHGQSIYVEALDHRIAIENLFEDRCIQSAFICETEAAAGELKARLNTI